MVAPPCIYKSEDGIEDHPKDKQKLKFQVPRPV